MVKVLADRLVVIVVPVITRVRSHEGFRFGVLVLVCQPLNQPGISGFASNLLQSFSVGILSQGFQLIAAGHYYSIQSVLVFGCELFWCRMVKIRECAEV